MAEEHETGVAGSEVTGDAEVRGEREQGARDPGTTTDADSGEAGRPSQHPDAPPAEDELAGPETGGTGGA
jgi:hypothetical protein